MSSNRESSPGRPRRGFVLASMVLGACVIGAAHAEGVERSELAVEGRIWSIAVADLDGDERKDLIVVSLSGHGAELIRRASIFWHGPGRRFSDRPDVTWELPPEIVALDPFGHESSENPATPVYSLQADGVYRHTFRRGHNGVESVPVLTAELTHLVAPDSSLSVSDFAAPWSGGETEFLVPEFPHSRLHRINGSAVGEAVSIPIAPVARYGFNRPGGQGNGAMWASYTFPVPVSADQDGDGDPDMVFVERDRVSVFESSLDADSEDYRRVYALNVLTEEEAALGSFQIRHHLTDLDGDDRMDLVVVVFRQSGVLELEGRMMVFRARDDGGFSPDPDQVLRVEDGLYYWTWFLDLDDDGKKEIVVPSAKIGVLGYIRIFMTRKVAFDLNTLRLDAGGAFDTDSILSESMSVKLSKDRDLPVITLEEMDGDGVVDLIVGDGDDEVCVHRGTTESRSRCFSSRSETCFAADPFGRILTDDLDMDGKREVIHYSVEGPARGKIFVSFLEAP